MVIMMLKKTINRMQEIHANLITKHDKVLFKVFSIFLSLISYIAMILIGNRIHGTNGMLLSVIVLLSIDLLYMPFERLAYIIIKQIKKYNE